MILASVVRGEENRFLTAKLLIGLDQMENSA